MSRVRIVIVVMVALLVIGAGYAAAFQQPPEGFVPVEQLPTDEGMPAAPLVATAYAVAWGAIMVYVWTVWRRLSKVQRELAEVKGRIGNR